MNRILKLSAALMIAALAIVPNAYAVGRRPVEASLVQRDLWGSAVPLDSTVFTLGGGGTVDSFKTLSTDIADLDYTANQYGPYSSTTYGAAVVDVWSVAGTIVAPDTVSVAVDWSPNGVAWHSGSFVDAYITGTDHATSIPVKIDTQAQGTAYLASQWRVRMRGNPVSTPSLPGVKAVLRLHKYNQ